jgi:hypothetical protein
MSQNSKPMKRVLQHSNSIIALLAVAIFASCSSYNHLTIGVTEPAPVDFPVGVKKVGIINRASVSDTTGKVMEGIDKVLSLEGKELDKLGSERAVTGLFDGLTGLERFDEVKIIETHNAGRSPMSVFPAPVPWETIEEICKANGVETVFELSYYDTDASFTFDIVPVNVSSPVGSVTLPEHQLTITTVIKTGWRIYDLQSKTIRDEFVMNERQVSSGRGINPMIAYETIKGRKESVLQISGNIGTDYGYRIMPFYIRVSRIYFVRGTDNFKTGKRMARVGDWHGAAALWEKELTHPKRKVAGRACYNMAIINEIDGNLEDAAKWASKSYVEYKNKKALDYLNILNFRIQQNRRLQNQQE